MLVLLTQHTCFNALTLTALDDGMMTHGHPGWFTGQRVW